MDRSKRIFTPYRILLIAAFALGFAIFYLKWPVVSILFLAGAFLLWLILNLIEASGQLDEREKYITTTSIVILSAIVLYSLMESRDRYTTVLLITLIVMLIPLTRMKKE